MADTDDVTVEFGGSSRSSRVGIVRRFGDLDVALYVPAEVAGESREVQTTATEVVPFTPAELRERGAALDIESVSA